MERQTEIKQSVPRHTTHPLVSRLTMHEFIEGQPTARAPTQHGNNNLTKFGAFVDIGIKESGLIHISNMSDTFVSDPSDILKLGQHITVEVLSIELERNRIQLKLISN